ncbi:MAG: hypothetical protein F7C82_04285 [Desulfurococcales archaeon]|nr:hypothetical protein [Desulfurococcales archaeon]MCE4622723.1 hypothetical protein [Desulfurococcales archaeon]MCE4627422.1 hypothetical protein [Desulfurococcales archaeon]MCE4629477.1 hypothetical protein [Desulfurococcales archaeon]
MLKDALKRIGFETTLKEVYHSTLTGGKTRETRLVAYSIERNIKVTYSEFSDGKKKLSILIQGSSATKDKEEKLANAGWKVDLEEGERLYAVIEVKDQNHAEEIINEVFKNNRS